MYEEENGPRLSCASASRAVCVSVCVCVWVWVCVGVFLFVRSCACFFFQKAGRRVSVSEFAEVITWVVLCSWRLLPRH